MKNYFELTDEEKLAFKEKIKSYPRPAKFTKAQPEVVEEEVIEDIPAKKIPVTEEPTVSSKKSKKINHGN